MAVLTVASLAAFTAIHKCYTPSDPGESQTRLHADSRMESEYSRESEYSDDSPRTALAGRVWEAFGSVCPNRRGGLPCQGFTTYVVRYLLKLNEFMFEHLKLTEPGVRPPVLRRLVLR